MLASHLCFFFRFSPGGVRRQRRDEDEALDALPVGGAAAARGTEAAQAERRRQVCHTPGSLLISPALVVVFALLFRLTRPALPRRRGNTDLPSPSPPPFFFFLGLQNDLRCCALQSSLYATTWRGWQLCFFFSSSPLSYPDWAAKKKDKHEKDHIVNDHHHPKKNLALWQPCLFLSSTSLRSSSPYHYPTNIASVGCSKVFFFTIVTPALAY